MAKPLIILGASARAAAGSARLAGYEPWCVDRFADRDLRATATVRKCEQGQYPSGILRLLSDAPADAPVLLTGAMENHLELVEAIAFDRALLTSPVEAMRQVRNPDALSSLPKIEGLRFAKLRTHPSLLGRLRRLAFGFLEHKRYLIKPLRSAGGVGIDFCSPAAACDEEHYLQQYIQGMSMSAVFSADGWSAALLGVTEQLIGESAFGSSGFRYAGSIGPMPLSEKTRASLAHLGVVLAQRHDLRGIFGVDLVMDMKGRLVPVEVNPRYTASVEVLEKTGLVALNRAVGAWAVKRNSATGKIHGKAIITAKTSCRVGDLFEVLPADAVADVPEVDAVFEQGEPICTVFAAAATRNACFESLTRRAQRVYDSLRQA